ncbi:MAG: hypothetical protein WDA09_05475 [Bacteriovoracaceae bacterium]
MSKSNFLNFLVEETLKLHSQTTSFCDLERKLIDYDILFLRGEFVPQIQMLRFQSHWGMIDIPINWSCFNLEQGQDYYWVRAGDPEETLLKVMAKKWDSQVNSLLIMQAEGYCYIIGLKESDEFYLRDLINPQEILTKAA